MKFARIILLIVALTATAAAQATTYTLEGRASMWKRSKLMKDDDLPQAFAQIEEVMIVSGRFHDPNDADVQAIAMCLGPEYTKLKRIADTTGWNTRSFLGLANNPPITVERQAFMNCAYPVFNRMIFKVPKEAEPSKTVMDFVGDKR